MGEMAILNKHGETKHGWDPNNPAEVEAAREVFLTYKSRGYAASRMENGAAGEIIREFDPWVAEIVFIPQFQGG